MDDMKKREGKKGRKEGGKGREESEEGKGKEGRRKQKDISVRVLRHNGSKCLRKLERNNVIGIFQNCILLA